MILRDVVLRRYVSTEFSHTGEDLFLYIAENIWSGRRLRSGFGRVMAEKKTLARRFNVS